MNYLLLIQSLLPLLNAVLEAAKVGGATADEVAAIESALSELAAVYNTDVTPSQLEGLRLT